jgi:hypothetical protein
MPPLPVTTGGLRVRPKLDTRLRDEIERQRRDWSAPAEGADVALGTA